MITQDLFAALPAPAPVPPERQVFTFPVVRCQRDTCRLHYLDVPFLTWRVAGFCSLSCQKGLT